MGLKEGEESREVFAGEVPSGNGPPAQDTYSSAFAVAYIFNLIVGVGALSLPKAFSDAGIILGTILLFILAFTSYMTATFMIEAMAIANAYVIYRRRRKERTVDFAHVSNIQHLKQQSYRATDDHSLRKTRSPTPTGGGNPEKEKLIPAVITDDDDDDDDYAAGPSRYCTITADDYEINTKYEMGAMANMFYHPIGIIVYYIVLCLYLYGDLAIYAVAIPKSMVVVVCTKPPNVSNEANHTGSTGKFVPHDICFGDVTQQQAFYIFLAVTALILCPWTFFNLSKSKYLQLLTTVLRNIAFILMVVIAIINLSRNGRAAPHYASFTGFPVLFGVSIYSFMCQHSLPGMVTPMKSKRRIFPLLFFDFSLILFFYLLIAYTGAFTFSYDNLNDVYSLNFFTQFSKSLLPLDQALAVLGYYLALFPVFTLGSNFPIISITLRENLKSLFQQVFKHCRGEEPFHWAINRIVFPLLALVPALAIACGTQNVQILVGVTGAFPGVGVQYIIPATLAFCGKHIVKNRLKLSYDNKHKSPFSYLFFLIVVIVWTVVSVAVIIADDVLKIVQHKFED